MLCPNCSEMIVELQLIKSNAKYMPGRSEPVEYDATCPHCREMIGRMSWGQLTANPDLREKGLDPHFKIPPAPAHPEPRAEPEPAGYGGPEYLEDTEPVSRIKRCPHCGMLLPEGL